MVNSLPDDVDEYIMSSVQYVSEIGIESLIIIIIRTILIVL